MNEGYRTELRLPNDLRFLRMVRDYVRQLAAVAQLPDERAEALVLAADEAVTNVIEHAFEPGEQGVYSVVGDLGVGEVTLSVQDQGLPFDPSLGPAYSAPVGARPEKAAARGLGLHLIRQAADEVCWINRGRQGKELRLVVRHTGADVTRQLPQAELELFRSDEPTAPEQHYVLRRLQPRDAVQVARCIYRTYGYTYPNDDLYYPERIAALNESGQLLSAVMVAEDGEIVGHYALERPDLGKVAESGQAVVVPAHRGRQLMQRMRAFLEDEARRLGLVGIFGQPVTSHVRSQKVNESFGSSVCGVTLGLAPREVTFKKIQQAAQGQRESCMLYFKPLTPAERSPIHVPAHHREMLKRVYDHLGVEVEFEEGAAPEGLGSVEVAFHRTWGVGFVRTSRVGSDSAVEVRRALRDLVELAGAEVVYLEIPLAQSGAPDLCRAAESSGFFFSGLGPQFAPDGDVLRLQYCAVPLDTGLLQIQSPFGRDILAYAVSERRRVACAAQ